MNTSQLLAVDLLLSVLAASAWIAAAWMTASLSDKPRRSDLGLLLVGIAVAVTVGRYALLPALVAGSWWFASERITINVPLTAIPPAAWAAAAGVPFLLRRRNTGPPKPASQDPRRSREWAVLAMIAAAVSAVASLALTLLLGGPFPAPWSLVVLLFMVAASVLIAKLALFSPRPSSRRGTQSNTALRAGRRGGASPAGMRPTAATAVAGLMICTALGSGVFAWLGSRSADGATIAAAVAHHGGADVVVTDPTSVNSLVGETPPPTLWSGTTN